MPCKSQHKEPYILAMLRFYGLAANHTTISSTMIESIFVYSIRSAFVLALLYIPYMLMLRQESFFRLNRMVLLFILLLSLVLPFLNVESLAWQGTGMTSDNGEMAFLPTTLLQVLVLPEVSVYADTGTMETCSTVPSSVMPSAFHWMSVAYIMVMAGTILWRLWQIVHMSRVVKHGSLWQQTRDGVHIYCHADDVSPYSWMNSVVINQRDYMENGREILLHEMAHIRSRHSWDLLLLALVQALQWWNPLIYILGSSLRDVHEYQADDSVLRHGVSARAYQLLLIKKVVGSSSYAFANNFDHSLIIKRITMMQKSKSSKWMFGKVLYILPMAALALSAFATSSVIQYPADTVANDTVASLPALRGKAMKIHRHGKVISIGKTEKASVSRDEASMHRSDSTVTVQVNWQKTGVYDFRKLAPSDIVSVDVSKDDAHALAVSNVNAPLMIIRSKVDGDSIVETSWTNINYCPAPAVLPEFPGGNAGMLKFLQDEMRYPAEAMSQAVHGRVHVEFYIGPDGSVLDGVRPIRLDKYDINSNASLSEVATADYVEKCKAQGKTVSPEERLAYKRGVESLLNEATRVVNKMPKWAPGYRDKEKTQACTTHFVLPVVFRLK